MRFSFFTAVLLAVAVSVSAQTFRGGVAGTVTDPSGAAIAGASLKLTGTDTGLTRSSESGSSGEFAFQDLPLGRYSLTVNGAGFQPLNITGINVEAGKTFDMSAKLELASQATSVQVEASSVAVETSSSSLTSVIPTKVITDVPLNGRDFTQLLKLNPGVNAAGSLNGTRTNSIDYQIDGADNNDQWHNSAAVNQGGVSGVAGTLLPIDAIDQFSVQSSSDAEAGRNGGGVLNLVIKSGTNAFHGSLYYFNRNEFLIARNWFVAPNAPVQKFRNNQPGGSFGGPLWRNHTFFFVTYEQQNLLTGNTAQGTTPSAAWVSEATSLLAARGVAVNPVSLRLINAYWPANSLTGPATQNNFFSSANSTSDSYNGIVKIDHIFNERNNISARYFGGTGQQTAYAGSVLPYYYQVAPSRMHNFSVVYNTVITPKFVGQTTAGVNYFKQTFNDAFTGFLAPSLGLNTGVTNPSLSGAPDILVSGFDETGLTPPLGRIDTTGQLGQTFTYTVGTHQLRFGSEYRRARLDVFYQRNSRGTFTFDGSQGPFQQTSSDTWNTAAFLRGTPNASLNSLADFLAGRLGTNQAGIIYGDRQRNYYLNSTSAFVQDSWKMRPNLTLNYGVNWIYQSPLSDPTNRISTFIPSMGGITYVGQGITTLYPRDWNNLAPRFGFAYQPTGSNRIVIRGGYGIFYQVPNVNYFGDNRPPNRGATGVLSNPGGVAPVYTLSNQTPFTIQSGVPIFGSSTFPTGPFGAFSVSQNFRTGYVQNSNLNVQLQLNNSTVLEVGYTGSLSRKLPVTLDINQKMIGTGVRPYPNFNLTTINEVQSVGNGYYNGAIVSLRSSNFHRLTAKLNYTYGHSRDDLSGARGVIPQNSYCLKCDYADSDFDVRHSFAGYIGYDVPSPDRFKMLLGGWQLNSLLSFSTGTPFTVKAGKNTSGTGENNDRAQLVGNPYANVPAEIPNTAVYWFNPAAFALPASGTYGNVGRNSLRGPGITQVDFSVFKNNTITERVRLQLRLDIFNLFNSRVLSLPTASASSGGNGQITQTLDSYNGAAGLGTGASRNVQLGAKLIF